MPVKTATREVVAPKLRPNLLLATEARMGLGPARSLLPRKGEQEEVKKQSQVGLVAWAPGPYPLASTIEAVLPGLPCNKTRPHSSDLHDRAALPAGRTARRPAPARSSPWRRGLAPGEGAMPCHRKTSRTAAPRDRGGDAGAPQKELQSLLSAVEEGKRAFPTLAGRDAAPPSAQPQIPACGAAPLSDLSHPPAPPIGRTAQAQPGPREFLWAGAAKDQPTGVRGSGRGQAC